MEKMKFIEKLTETKDSLNAKERKDELSMFGSYEDMGFRMLERLKINDKIHLSIQASYGGHYCLPRKTLPLEDYTSMELAIFKDGDFASVDQVTDNQSLINKFNECYEGTVYSYVPVELLEELYQDLTS